MGHFMLQTNCHQHMGWIQRTGCAGRSTGSCDTQCIQQQQQGFPFDIGEGNIAVTGQSFRRMTIQTAMRNTFQNTIDEFISQGCQAFCHCFHFLTSNFCSLAHAHDTGNIFCAGTLFFLLGTAEDQRRNRRAFADVDGTDAFGSTQLMTAHGKQVNVHAVHINRHVTNCLYGVCMEQDAMFSGNFTDFPDKLDRTDLIIGKHYGDQNRFRANGLFHFFRRYTPKLVHSQISHLYAFLFQIFCGMQNSMMFNFCCNDMFLFFLAGIYHTAQCHVIAFGTTGCKVDFLRLCTDQVCNLRSCIFQCFFAFLCNGIYAGSVAVIFSEIWQDRLQHFFSYGCCCCIIHVNPCCHIDTPLLLYFISYYFYMFYVI